MKRTLALALFMAAALAPTHSQAACVCRCVDGEVQPLCQNGFELRPYCTDLMLCPLVPPSLPPLDPPGALPLGTIECRQAYVCDVYGRHCRWRRICED